MITHKHFCEIFKNDALYKKKKKKKKKKKQEALLTLSLLTLP